MASLRKSSALVLAFAVLASFFVVHGIAWANPLDIITSNITATTTVAYMTPGTATTTYYYDSYASSLGDPNATDRGSLLVQFTASSTSSKLAWKYEFAQGAPGIDCVSTPTNCDWYADNTSMLSTTTPSMDFTLGQTDTWTFASSSQNGAAVSASNNRGLKAVLVPTPARYIRAIFSVPVGATNGGVWAAFVNQKQQPE